MAKKQGDSTTLIEKWAIWIIGLSIVLLLFGFGCFVFNKAIKTPSVERLEIKIIQDTVSTSELYSKHEVDSLIKVTKNTLESYEHHFKTVTEQKEQEDIYKSFGALLLSVIVGLCGFFGFKSFKDIKDRGEQMAKEVATTKAKEEAAKVAQKAAEKYLASKLPEVVQKQFEESFNETAINSIKNSVKADLIPQIMQEIQKQEDGVGEGQEEDQAENPTQPMSPEEMFNKQNA